jgi:hypothetical protein
VDIDIQSHYPWINYRLPSLVSHTISHIQSLWACGAVGSSHIFAATQKADDV